MNSKYFRLVLIILFIFLYNHTQSLYSQFKLKPILLNYNNYLIDNESYFLQSDNGWIKKYKNNFPNYDLIKINLNEKHVKIFYFENNLFSISTNMSICRMDSKNSEFNLVTKIEHEEGDEVIDLVVINKYIFIYSFKYIYKLNDQFEIIDKIHNNVHSSLLYQYKYNYKWTLHPIIHFNGKILALTDTTNLSIYDDNLNLLQQFNLKEILTLNRNFVDCKIYNTNENVFVFAWDKIIILDNKFNFVKEDKSNVNFYFNATFNDKDFYYVTPTNNGDIIYKYNENSSQFDSVIVIIKENYSTDIENKLIFLNNGSIHLIGSNNFYCRLNLLENKYDIISNSSSRSVSNLIISKFNQDQVITLREFENKFFWDISTLSIDKDNFIPIINMKNNSSINLNLPFSTYYLEENNIIIGSSPENRESYIYKSIDFGNKFEIIDKNLIPFNDIQNAIIEKNNNLFAFYTNINRQNQKSSLIVVTDLLFNKISENLLNENILNLVILDSLNFQLLSLNDKLKLEFKSTTDKGETWEVYKEYPTFVNLLENKELELNGKKIWAYSYFDFATDKFHLDVINVDERKVYSVFEKELTQDEIDTWDFIGFDAAKEKFYLSFYNTLMVSSNIFDENIKWETFNYPNNGRVNKKLQIFDKTIFARYEDDKNEDNVYWINGIEMVGDPTSVENTENQIEEVNYLYTMPPYPNPTRSEVTAKFYWDSRIDIDNSEIGVYDLNGNKVSGKENLSLEKLNEWSGNIKWNCTGVPSGTYLIKIQHGNNTKSVKVVVN